MVEEEQLPVRLQLTAGNEDSTDVTGLDTDENGPNTVTNIIVGTFSSSLSSFTGNDGPVAYSFLPVLDGTRVLKTDGGNLTSQGANVLFALSGGMLIGYMDVRAAGYVDGIDRQVELNQPVDGQYRPRFDAPSPVHRAMKQWSPAGGAPPTGLTASSRTLRSKDEVYLVQVQSNTRQDNHHLCPGDAIRIEGYVGITTALGPRD